MTLTKIGDTNQGHRGRQLGLQNFDKVLNAFPAVIDSVQEWSAHANCRGAQTHALEDVGATTHAAVDEDLELREDRRAVELAFEERHYGGW